MEPGTLQPDFDRIRRARHEGRTPERLSARYQVEARLARQLSQSSRAERSYLYADLYRQLFADVPDHPWHGASTALRAGRIQAQAASLLEAMPSRIRTALALQPIMVNVAGVNLVGTK